MRIPTHPGKLLKEELSARHMSASGLAKALGVDAPRINDIVRCKRRITADTALRLAQFFGGEAIFWMNLQVNHDLAITQKEQGDKIKREVRSAA
jgi:addiction module HigA family antidote